MGIKSLFTGLFGKSDNQMPSSLGNGQEVNQSYNLGNKSPLVEEEETPPVQVKEKHNRKKKLKKGGKHNKKSKKSNRYVWCECRRCLHC